jgi:transposase
MPLSIRNDVGSGAAPAGAAGEGRSRQRPADCRLPTLWKGCIGRVQRGWPEWTARPFGDWVRRYNAEGIAGLCNRPAPGRRPKLTEGQMATLKAVVLAGPDPAVDKIARWRAVDLCRWVEQRWDVSYSETGMLRLSWSFDLSHRKTRPRHPHSSEKAQQAFKRGFAARLKEIAKAHPATERFEI